MTPAAWIMLGITWAVVIFCTASFFAIILKKNNGNDE